MTISLIALALLALTQDPVPSPAPPVPETTPPQSPPSAGPTEQTPTTPARAELVRGTLPADASAEARASFAKLVAATRTDPNAASPTGFDLTFEGTVHPTQRQSNDFPKTRYRFDPRGWVRLSILASGRERLAGPKGMFVIDGKEVVQLTGREHDEDRRQIREELSIAKNFLALSDPKNLRLAKLELLPAPPAALPATLQARAAKLVWLALESPDFRLFQSQTADANANWRVELGLGATTNLPELVSITEIGASSMRPESAMLVEFRAYTPLDGLQVPSQLATYAVDANSIAAPTSGPNSPDRGGPLLWRYTRWSSLELGLKSGGTLRPAFTEADFTPPKK
ncbi:MAG: hypothetical protein L6Q99_10815 [Planctomycetes bacterium]|nr:hypothetical protein [Planctomycetota bacterium]